MRPCTDPRRRLRWIAPLLLLAMFSSACSSADEATETTGESTAQTVDEETPSTTALPTTTEPEPELTLTWSVVEVPEWTPPLEPPHPSPIRDADSDAAFVIMSGEVWRSTDLETFEMVSQIPLDKPGAFDVHGSTAVAAATAEISGACDRQGEPTRIAISDDLGNTWSIIETPIPQANLEHPDRLWPRLVQLATDGSSVLVSVAYTPDDFVPYSRCLISELHEGWMYIGHNSDGLLINTGEEVRTFTVDELDVSDDDRAILNGEIEVEAPDQEFWRYDVDEGTWTEAFVPPGVTFVGTDFVSTSWEVARSSHGLRWYDIDTPDGVTQVRANKAAVVGTGDDSNWISLDAGRTWEEVVSPVELQPAVDAIEYAGTVFYMFNLAGYGAPTLGYRKDLGEWQLTEISEISGREEGGASFLGVIDGALVISSGSELLVGRV